MSSFFKAFLSWSSLGTTRAHLPVQVSPELQHHKAGTHLTAYGGSCHTDRQAECPGTRSAVRGAQLTDEARAGMHSPRRQPPAAGDTSVISFLHPHRPARRRQTRTQGTHAPARRRTTRQPPPRPNEPHCSPAQPSDAKKDGQAWGER